MEDSSLLSLPAEILDLIVAEISKPSDLKRLCLACKTLNRAAIPKLYNRVVLNLKPENELDWVESLGMTARFLDLDHPGHKHVRSLVVPLSAVPSTLISTVTQAVQWLIRRIMQLLPRNSLHSISVFSLIPFDEETLVVLFTQQRALQKLEIGPIEQKLLDKGLISKACQHLRYLDIPHVVNGLGLYGTFVANSQQLDQLSIRARYQSRNDGRTPLSTAREDVSDRLRTLLGCDGSADQKPLLLKSLRLDGQVLTSATRPLLNRIKFEDLRYLRLTECSRDDIMLEALANRFTGTSAGLKSLVLDMPEGLDNELQVWQYLRRTEKLLRAFGGLKYLMIRITSPCIDGNVKFDVSCLQSHLATLEDLYIGIGNDDVRSLHWIMPLTDIKKLFIASKKLRQVALSMPPVELGKPFSTEYRDWLQCVAQATSVQILRCLTWPRARESHHDTAAGNHASHFFRHVDRFATDVLKCIHTEQGIGSGQSGLNLHVLCIGDSVPNDYALCADGEPIVVYDPCCYITGVQTSCFGAKEVVAIPMDGEEVSSIVPCFDAVSPRADNGIGYSLLEPGKLL